MLGLRSRLGASLKPWRRPNSILASRPRHAGALEVRALALAATGEVSEAYRTVRRLRAVADGPRAEELQGRLVGELRVAQPGWLPRLAGSARRTGEPLDRRVLVLSADRAAGEAAAAIGRAAGYDPVLVLAPLPGQDGAIEGPAPETVGQTSATLIRLDLGTVYPATAPLDRRLEDVAWLSSRVVEQVWPELVHVTAGAALLERAAIGESLRSRYPVALVVEAGAVLRPDKTPGSELARLRHVAQQRRYEAADGVVTPTPAGAADRQAVDRLGEAYAEALARRADRT